MSYANSDQKEHCPSDVNIWSVLTTTEVTITPSQLGIQKLHCVIQFYSGNMIAILKLNVKVSLSLQSWNFIKMCH